MSGILIIKHLLNGIFTVDVVDLQSFVNVSLTTSAGEGDLANDRLSNLSIIGTGYRSLIYELKQDAGFETLSKSCSTIWKALEENPKLPKLLVSHFLCYCIYDLISFNSNIHVLQCYKFLFIFTSALTLTRLIELYATMLSNMSWL